MKKFYFLLGMVFCLSIQVSAQSKSSKDVSMNYLSQQAKAWSLNSADYQDAVVSSEVYTKHNQVTSVYLNQTYKGIPIYNAITGIHVKNGKVVYATNGFHSDIEKRILGSKSAGLSAAQAVFKAAEQLDIQSPTVSQLRKSGSETVFGGSNISREEIPVKAMYQMTAEGKLVLTWDLSISMKDNADYWSIRLDANSGKIISQDNWTVYCTHEHSLANHSHKAGERCEGHTERTAKKETTVEATPPPPSASYQVYALPAESPNHGPFITVNDPSDDDASPFGWHDVDGEEGADYTITRGNNVHAYLDIEDRNASSGGEPDGGVDLVFDFVHNTSTEPSENTDAAQTNLFYANNMIHDIYYNFGFDEGSGNFQENNYNNVGQGGDYVQAEALDGSGTNNANFATPTEGFRPRMQMFLWQNSSDVFKITSPSSLSGVIQGGEVGVANFGDPITADTDVSGVLALARGDSPDSPTQACSEIVNGADIAGKIAIVDRGLCDFSLKAFNVQQAGAIGCIIVNVPGVNGGTGEELLNPAAGDNSNQVTIPTIFIKTSDGNTIKATLNSEEVTGLFKDESETSNLDASFDNGVIAHEYGHGISTRLTGGANNSGCLISPDEDGDGRSDLGEQMGEGWSDFFALVVTVKEGDKGSDARGIGTYVSGEAADGIGIRQFPYSTDMSINPHTYLDINNVPYGGATGYAPHPVGTPWATMLWDLYWALSDKYGWSADLKDHTAGNNIAVQLVIDGLKLQPCNPGYEQSRDAILQADQINNGGENELLIWEVFARRGLGFEASSGDTREHRDGVESFSIPPLLVEELKITRASAELVKPGEIVGVNLSIVNHIPSTQENVIVTDELQDGQTYVAGSANFEITVNGNILTFEVGTLTYEQEMTITYSVLADAEVKSQSILFDNFDDEGDWEEMDLEDSGFSWFNDDVGIEESGGWGVDEVSLETDQVLISPSISVVGEKPVLRFWHMYDTSPAANGGFVQISNNDGLTYKSVGADAYLRNGTSRALQYGLFAIPALDGFSGTTGGEFIDTYIDLTEYEGQDIRVRYRFGSQEEGTPADVEFPGWYVDDFELMDIKTYANMACIGTQAEPNQNCVMTSIVVDSDGIVSNEDLQQDYFGVRVFPNPADDYISVGISAPSNETAQVRLINVDGRVVHTSTRNVNASESVEAIITKDFTPGMYILEVRTDNKVTTKKAILK